MTVLYTDTLTGGAGGSIVGRSAGTLGAWVLGDSFNGSFFNTTYSDPLRFSPSTGVGVGWSSTTQYGAACRIALPNTLFAPYNSSADPLRISFRLAAIGFDNSFAVGVGIGPDHDPEAYANITLQGRSTSTIRVDTKGAASFGTGNVGGLFEMIVDSVAHTIVVKYGGSTIISDGTTGATAPAVPYLNLRVPSLVALVTDFTVETITSGGGGPPPPPPPPPPPTPGFWTAFVNSYEVP